MGRAIVTFLRYGEKVLIRITVVERGLSAVKKRG